jgi:hypothetical protein
MPSLVTKRIGLHAVFRPDSKSLLIVSSNGAMCRSADHDLGLNLTNALPPLGSNLKESGGASITSLEKAPSRGGLIQSGSTREAIRWLRVLLP